MQRVQGGGGRARHPGGVGAGLRVRDLLLEHRGHQVGHRPHALADLRAAAQAGAQTHQHVVALVGLDPGAGLHVALAQHRTGQHRGVHLVAGAVEEAGVDEGHTARRRGDAGGEVDAGAALLVHDAQLHRRCRQAQQLLDAAEQLVGEADLGRSMHLGLDDVDRAAARVAQARARQLLQVMQRDQRRDDGVHDPFRDLAPAVQQNGRIGHQVADIAHEQQRTSRQHDVLASVRRLVDAVRVEAAHEAAAALADLLGQRTPQDAQPVAVGEQLVLGIDGGDRVLQVEDGRQRRLHQQVGHAGRVGLADRRGAIDLHFDVQAVMAQQDGRRRRGVAQVADELRRVRQADVATVLQRDGERAAIDAIAGGVGVRGARERRGLVQHLAREGDDLGAAGRVVAAGPFGAVGFGNDVGAVERVVQRAPAGVGRVQRVTRVQDGDHQLRAGLDRQFRVHVGGRRLRIGGQRCQVADLLEEGLIRRHVADRTGVGAMPAVQFGLQPIALRQQGGVLRRQVMGQRIEALPERGGLDAGAGQRLGLDETGQGGVDLEAVVLAACAHGGSQDAKEWRPEGGGKTRAGARSCPIGTHRL